MMFMGSALVLPKGRPTDAIDLRAHYYRERVPFFAFGLLFLAVDSSSCGCLAIRFAARRCSFSPFSHRSRLVALFTSRPRVHEIIAPVMAVGIVIFIGVMFARLRPE